MEILTRKSLEKILSTRNTRDVYASDLLDEDLFEETDQFSVDRLRPMSALDDYDGVDVLAYNKRLKRFVHFSYDNIAEWWLIYEFGCIYYSHDRHHDRYSGFMPMPTYEPEGQN